MTATLQGTRRDWDRLAQWWFGLPPTVRLVARWALIAVLTFVAFRASLRNLVETTLEGGLIGYVWMVPIAAALAALGVNFRRRTELPIHDRQTDIIVGVIGLGLALMVQGVLLKRYSEFFHLMRLDLLALWLFMVSSALVLFGVRPVARFGWVWVLLSLISALPYQVVVIALGGGNFAAGVGTLLIAAAATAIAVESHPQACGGRRARRIRIRFRDPLRYRQTVAARTGDRLSDDSVAGLDRRGGHRSVPVHAPRSAEDAARP
ncbi:hypothetical protein ACNQR9_11260 [Mycolicibacterium peregrinum]